MCTGTIWGCHENTDSDSVWGEAWDRISNKLPSDVDAASLRTKMLTARWESTGKLRHHYLKCPHFHWWGKLRPGLVKGCPPGPTVSTCKSGPSCPLERSLTPTVWPAQARGHTHVSHHLLLKEEIRPQISSSSLTTLNFQPTKAIKRDHLNPARSGWLPFPIFTTALP